MRRPLSSNRGTMSTAKPWRAPAAARIVGRAGAVGAEMEIEADRDAGDREPLDQDALDEFLGAERRQRRVEAQHDRAVEPGRRQQPQLVALVGQPEQRLLRAEEAARMRLEGQRRRRPAERARRARARSRSPPGGRDARRRNCRWRPPRRAARWPGGVSPWATTKCVGSVSDALPWLRTFGDVTARRPFGRQG